MKPFKKVVIALVAISFVVTGSAMIEEETAPLQSIPEPEEVSRGGISTGMPGGFGVQEKVLIIPATEVNEENLAAIAEDMQVMAHILDKKFRGPNRITGMFRDFGPFFSSNGRKTEAIYLEGYGALFLIEVNFPLSGPPAPAEKQPKPKEPADTVWEQAKSELFNPRGPGVTAEGGPPQTGPEYNEEKVKELKTELTKSLKHAANIRNLKSDEWVVITVRSLAQEYGFVEGIQTYPDVERYRWFKRSDSGEGIYGGGGYGGGYGVGGYGGGGFGGSRGGGAFGGIAFPSKTAVTIRVKKSVIDDYAKEKLNFEQFEKQVKILMY